LTQRSAEGPELELERSGGFGGLTLRAVVPFSRLTPAERDAVQASLSSPPHRRHRPDRFEYRLRLGGREAVIEEEDLPSVLRPLLRRLDLPR
jgi:hypothetical protein